MTLPGTIGKRFVINIRSLKLPTQSSACLAPGTNTVTKCPAL